MIYALLFGAGLAAGTLNVIAGGGSLLTLPVLIFAGLPAGVANGTNRIAILVQNVGAVSSFQRRRMIDWRWLWLSAAPGLLGAGLGTWLAVRIDDASFQRVLAGVMVVVALWTLWRPLGDRPVGEAMRDLDRPGRRALIVAGFFLAGVWGGFIQAGVGFLILAITTLAGLNLVRGNALKALFVLTYTPLALTLFALEGKVDLGFGLALAAGNLTGALIGVRLAIRKGHAWIRRVVTATVIVFAIRLWLTG